ncbi:MAG: MBL fold metallo-hydrolase [Pseudomonadota bacterium]|nr:MBL fold metallo-hydrolase [Pseudomonadota bacterium]
MSLFQRDVTVCVLSSGSAGNCTYVGDGHAGVLIDCGVSTKQILTRMAEVGLADAPIDAVLVTHEHTDHIGAAAILGRALAKRGRPVPFYMTRGTSVGVPEPSVPDGVEIIEAGTGFRVRHLHVEPIPVPHDTRDPVAYRINVGDAAVAVITDLGRPTALLARHMRECHAVVLEFNHDEDMLMEGPYPYPLKQRIKGSHGHLSNRQAQDLLMDGLGAHLRHLMLAHLSEDNNTPTRALVAAQMTLQAGGAFGRVAVNVCLQRAALPPVKVQTRTW